MQLPPDFKEFIELLNTREVRYVMIGGWVYNLYAPPRMTGDIDFFIEITPANEQKLRLVLTDFGFSSALPKPGAPWLVPEKVIMLGREPCRIDILCRVDGITFDEAFADRRVVTCEGVTIPVLSIENLIRNKEAAGRDKDLLDVATLRMIKKK